MEEARATVLDLNVLLASILKPKGPTAATLLTLYLRGEDLYIPDYVKEEFQSIIGELVERKGLNPETLKALFQMILRLTIQVNIGSYEKYIEQAGGLVNDPKDTPYVALALYLREQYETVVILTYNKKDYKVEELAGNGIIVMTPGELRQAKI